MGVGGDEEGEKEEEEGETEEEEAPEPLECLLCWLNCCGCKTEPLDDKCPMDESEVEEVEEAKFSLLSPL